MNSVKKVLLKSSHSVILIELNWSGVLPLIILLVTSNNKTTCFLKYFITFVFFTIHSYSSVYVCIFIYAFMYVYLCACVYAHKHIKHK